ncbi:hypothetical protein AGMMS49991_04060 [Spirochaetia bacterium]|nr:hypothetical protein AGMMS49991_04060 [Spirochaetia bacterium]
MKTGTIFLDTENKVSLTFYIHDHSPEMPNANIRPAMLILPGGAYRACSDREAEPIALAYIAEGYQAFVLRYSVGGTGFAPALRDAEKALETIRSHAEEWRIEIAKVAVAGFSAGGHLAAFLGTAGRVRPNAMILGYPCIVETTKEDRVLPFPIPGADKTVDAKTPPAFIFATWNDELVPAENSLRMANALNVAGIPFELHIFQKGAHGLSLAKAWTSGGAKTMVSHDVSQWFSLSVRWLHGLFGDFPADREQSMNGVLTEYLEYGVDVSIRDLWANENCRKILLDFLPMLDDEKARQSAMQVSPRIMIKYAPDILSNTDLDAMNSCLKKIQRRV